MHEDIIPERFFEELKEFATVEQIIRDNSLIQSAEKGTLGVKTQVGSIFKPQ